jgi:hypothetical protein
MVEHRNVDCTHDRCDGGFDVRPGRPAWLRLPCEIAACVAGEWAVRDADRGTTTIFRGIVVRLQSLKRRKQ